MAEHRIEITVRTPTQELKTVTVTIEADTSPAKLERFSSQASSFFAGLLDGDPALTVEHCRDYRVSAKA